MKGQEVSGHFLHSYDAPPELLMNSDLRLDVKGTFIIKEGTKPSGHHIIRLFQIYKITT